MSGFWVLGAGGRTLGSWGLGIGCWAGALGAQQAVPFTSGDAVTVRATNALAIDRRDETVSIPWSTLAPRLRDGGPGQVRVVDDAGREIVSQLFDAEADGRPDSLLFQADFRPNEVRTFRVEARAPGKMESRVHVRHDVPRDDIAWENDRVAFRLYGQGLKKTPQAMSSSGLDAWAKRTRALVLEKWYEKDGKNGQSYHMDTGEGADFYDVGQTLGAGGTAVWRNDSLHRADNFASWRLIAGGPIRAVIEVKYDPWDAAGQRVSEIKRISIDAGQNLFRQDGVFRLESGSGEIPYAIGVLKRPGLVGVTSKAQSWAWLTGWGPLTRAGSHGEFGTTVMLSRERVSDWKETATHYLATSRAVSGQPVVHYIGTGWTGSGDFATPQAWWAYLDTFARRLASPIGVAVQPSSR